MKKCRNIFLVLLFLGCSVVTSAEKEIPPWMEYIDDSKRGTYLVPKGAKRRIVGSQVIVEPPNEYVARRLYEMDAYLQEQFKKIEESQKAFQQQLDELQREIEQLQKDRQLKEDVDALKTAVNDLNQFKKEIEDMKPEEEVADESGVINEPGEGGEGEKPETLPAEEEKAPSLDK